MASITYQQKKSLPAIEQILISIFAALVIGTAILIAFGLGVQVWMSGKIAPGVTISDIEIGGLTPDEATMLINENITYPQDGKIV